MITEGKMDKEVLVRKQQFTVEQFDRVTDPEELLICKGKATEILNMVERWLEEGGPWLLGDKYSMADVIFTTMLSRLSFNA